MSGHSKWNNIKRKKEKTDGAKAKVFTKIGREISVAVRTGGPNPASNSKLADLISKAKRMSVRTITSSVSSRRPRAAIRPSTRRSPTRVTAPAAWQSWSRL